MHAARELSYVPNAFARGLITGKSGFAALVVPDITDPFFARLAFSLDQALWPAGMILIVCHTGEQRREEEHLTQLLEERQIEGLVWVSEAPTDASPSPLDGSRIPKVMIERLPEGTLADAILLDKQGVDDVADYLVGLGHRRIGMVTGHPRTYGGR
ncbi:MAG: LacI family DNA-binding transcriptional regulator, partial [Anaerolineales bacterium]